MGDDITQCPDGHFCLNGSLCQEIEGDEGNYFCDCDVAFNKNGNAYEGLKCQHKATVYCTYDEAVSRKSFCTNGGECLAEVSSSDAHVGCRCDDNYEGEHCQFVKGTRPDGWPYNGSTSSANSAVKNQSGGGGGLNGGAIFGIILAVLVGAVLVAFIVHRTLKKRASKGPSAASEGVSHDIDPDGGVLQDAIDGKPSEESQIGGGDEFGETMKNEEVAEDGEEGEII